VVGDLVQLNVNGTDGCTNPVYHVARVVAVGSKALVFEDTLNPKGGFTAADYARYAAKFDTLIYPLDVGAFGAPTDIDNNGHIGLIFTRAVNELTPPRSSQYVGGFTFSRDLFPATATTRAEACPASNQGEFFYLLAPDPTGAINSNVRTAGFVDSVTTPVIAHEFQHLINASRRLYVNTASAAFEQKWLDEGLAHSAEEMLFYRESGMTPRSNIVVTDIRASERRRNAFNQDIAGGGNSARYRRYLLNPQKSSPYADDDSLSTRGAAWSLLRYLADQKAASVTRSPSGSTSLSGPGSVSVPGGTTGAEYYAAIVNGATTASVSVTYTVSASNVIAPAMPFLAAMTSPTLARLAAPDGAGGVLQPDMAFEARLRDTERSLLVSHFQGARSWYRGRASRSLIPVPSIPTADVAPFPSPDGDVWYRLVNNTATGITNVQQVFGTDFAGWVRDWSASHATDDLATTVPEFQQPSWNWHNIYPALDGGAYPLPVQAMGNGTAYSGTLVAGGSAFFKLGVSATGTATITLATQSGAAGSNLQLVLVRK
jgi:hypothetical protein